ncbi:hypothetical protein [Enterobacter sp. CC120223-11]|uniref:MrpH family fimbial adhesin n=1 Tax=Enterobacter sp. CC120223-11 TaxID=1378073 RepID=UPI000BC50899|nr:hypothetical protein [Enterobacter sp. CC120223-11]SNY79839.1 hypothetical protein SAMN02744775_04273 [Enterobacter sp. CC120223-11]
MRKIITYSLMFFSMPALCGINSTIDSSINTKDCLPNGGCKQVDYLYTMHNWDYSDPTPNPLYMRNKGVLFIGHRHVAAGTSGPMFEYSSIRSIINLPCMATAPTIGELGQCYNSSFPFPYSGIMRHEGEQLSTECVGMFYSTTVGVLLPVDGAEGMPMLPSMICGVAPPPAGQCSLPGILEFDHGALSSENLQGNEKSASLIVDCNSAMSAKIYSAVDTVVLTPGLTSTLNLNNQVLGKSGVEVSLLAGANYLPMKSILNKTSKVSAGDYSGNTILILALP